MIAASRCPPLPLQARIKSAWFGLWPSNSWRLTHSDLVQLSRAISAALLFSKPRLELFSVNQNLSADSDNRAV